MKLEEFAKIYPGRPFALRYVERGEHKARSFIWHIKYTSDYFTSDSDREVYDHHAPNLPDGFGDSPEAAIDDMLRNTQASLEKATKCATEELLEAQQKLADFRAKQPA